MKAAEWGDMESQFIAGWRCVTGDMPGNEAKGIAFLRKAEAQGHMDAKALLGMLLLEESSGRTHRKGVALIREAADADSALGMLLLGMCYARGAGVRRDPQKAKVLIDTASAKDSSLLPILARSLNLDDPDGLMDASRSASEEMGGKQEEPAVSSLEWAVSGTAYAMPPVSLPSSGRSKELLERARAGDPVAQYQLAGSLYSAPKDTRDLAGAQEWLEKAAAQGLAAAQIALGQCLLPGGAFEENAAAQGNALGQFLLAHTYLTGTGVAGNVKVGIQWLRKSTDQGLAYAQERLGNCCFEGTGVKRSAKDAVRWYRKAAGQGLASAQNELGMMLLEGRGVRANPSEGLKWIGKAAEQRNLEAQLNMGDACFYGVGTARSRPGATRWYRKAAEQGSKLARERPEQMSEKESKSRRRRQDAPTG